MYTKQPRFKSRLNKHWASADFLLTKNLIQDGFYQEGFQIWSEYVLYTLIGRNPVFIDEPAGKKTCAKLNNTAWAICVDTRILTVQTGFYPLLNFCFNDKQINKWIHLSRNLGGISLCCDLFIKVTDQKNFLL